MSFALASPRPDPALSTPGTRPTPPQSAAQVVSPGRGHGAGTPPHFGYRRNASREEHLGRGGRAILRPKPLFHAVDEEFESEEESEEEAPAFGSLLSSDLSTCRSVVLQSRLRVLFACCANLGKALTLFRFCFPLLVHILEKILRSYQ